LTLMALIIDGLALQQMLNSPTGPVGEWLIGVAEVVKVKAQSNAPVDTGCLRDSIVKRFVSGSITGLVVTIQCDTAPCSPTHTAYSLFVHEGTEAHNIPNAFGYGPTFGVGGRFDGLFHPGTKPNRFLTDALEVLAI
jgi:hypothetical protein